MRTLQFLLVIVVGGCILLPDPSAPAPEPVECRLPNHEVRLVASKAICEAIRMEMWEELTKERRR